MAIFQPIVITNAGLNLLSQAVAGQGTLTFTSIVTSSTAISYNPTTIQGMTSLSGVVQTAVPARALLQDGTAQVSAVFDNSGLSQGYTVNTLGLYATLGSGAQTLFAVAVASTPDNIPAPSNLPASNFYYQFNISISDTSQLTIGIPGGGSLPASVFNQMFPGIVAPDQNNDGDALIYNVSSGAWGYVNTENALTTVSGSGEAVSLQKTLAGKFPQIQIFGKAIQDGTPAPDIEVPIQPVGVESSGEYQVPINTTGNQLFDASKISTKTQSGATVTNNDDGSFTVSGSGQLSSTFNQAYVYNHQDTVKILKAGALHLVADTSTYPILQIYIQTSSGAKSLVTNNPSAGSKTNEILQSVLGDTSSTLTLQFYGNSGTDIKPGTIKPMLYQSGDGAWEPFVEPNQVQFPFDTPLYGVPVSSGGNYTDASGQQWISDVADRQEASVTRYCGVQVFDGSADENWSLIKNVDGVLNFRVNLLQIGYGAYPKSICNRFIYLVDSNVSSNHYYLTSENLNIFINGSLLNNNDVEGFKTWLQSNPVTIVYPLETPTSEPFGFDLNTASATLQSLNPNTNIFSSTYPAAGLNIISQAFNIAGDLAQNLIDLQTTVQSQSSAIAENTEKLNTLGLVGYGRKIASQSGESISLASLIPEWSDTFTSGALYSVYFSVSFSEYNSGDTTFQPYILKSIRKGLQTTITQVELPTVYYQANSGNIIPYSCTFMIATNSDEDVSELEFHVDGNSHNFKDMTVAVYRIR